MTSFQGLTYVPDPQNLEVLSWVGSLHSFPLGVREDLLIQSLSAISLQGQESFLVADWSHFRNYLNPFTLLKTTSEEHSTQKKLHSVMQVQANLNLLSAGKICLKQRIFLAKRTSDLLFTSSQTF